MAKARAILKRLKAVRNIRKITRTMELIATARFKKAMDRASEASAYTRKISELVADLSQSLRNAQSDQGFSHPLLEVHTPRQNGVLLILTSNRGLCGGYNAGVMKQAMQRIRDRRAEEQTFRVEVSGKRGINFLRYQQQPIDETFTQFEDRPAFADVNLIADRYIELYCSRQIDWLDVAYMQFESASRQKAVVETLLPLGTVTDGPAETEATAAPLQYEFLPSPRAILEEILPAAFKARLFKCFLDAAVSEQIFRMVAMKGATENAGDMISNLSRQYNRARQAQITAELSEIIGGADALK